MGDAYLRTGRGGAGNFYSQKDVEDAVTKDRTEDIEAQKPPAKLDSNSTAPSALPPSSTGGGSAYVRAGRGGAGNFVMPPSNLPTTHSPPSLSPPPPSSSPPAVQQSSVPSSGGISRYSGRGGAGNWGDSNINSSESEGARRAKDEQEQRRKEALDAGIAREIRASLPQQPQRTYHLHEPGRGRRPEDDVVDS
ncbi:hypothetical protein GGR55DRAFT_253758 [Xylaria sp. FL0064]|nr:hypothetical protein GGR55DRAFT_253758 [Xylaria sp. FL0064]